MSQAARDPRHGRRTVRGEATHASRGGPAGRVPHGGTHDHDRPEHPHRRHRATSTRAFLAQAGRSIRDEDAFVAREVPLAPLRPHDLLVRVEAVSVNPVDTKSRHGLRSGTKQLGWDASGVVEASAPR